MAVTCAPRPFRITGQAASAVRATERQGKRSEGEEEPMRSMRCIIATVCVLAFAACASAQDDGADPLRNVPKVQIAGGFSSARELEVDQQLPAGWFVSAD